MDQRDDELDEHRLVQAVVGPDLRLLLLGVPGLRVVELGRDRVARDRGKHEEDQHVGEEDDDQGLAGAARGEAGVAPGRARGGRRGSGGEGPRRTARGGGGEGAHNGSLVAAWYEGIATALKVMPFRSGDCT